MLLWSYRGAYPSSWQTQVHNVIWREEANFYILYPTRLHNIPASSTIFHQVPQYSTRYHKSHHAWRAPIAAATAYGHPVLYWFRISLLSVKNPFWHRALYLIPSRYHPIQSHPSYSLQCSATSVCDVLLSLYFLPGGLLSSLCFACCTWPHLGNILSMYIFNSKLVVTQKLPIRMQAVFTFSHHRWWQLTGEIPHFHDLAVVSRHLPPWDQVAFNHPLLKVIVEKFNSWSWSLLSWSFTFFYCSDHSGFHFPWLRSPQAHDYHHKVKVSSFAFDHHHYLWSGRRSQLWKLFTRSGHAPRHWYQVMLLVIMLLIPLIWITMMTSADYVVDPSHDRNNENDDADDENDDADN